ncbi:glycosyltransferase family 2 protein [Salinicoccus carnicancri]|uniref:glycosyltransferase family 2 protein n=1 Tax=Salinicoccus carnicancri TaxID=558170 RepID=UPI00030D4491|nr:glycosyltransferase family 2 protein [Salinicoccus carnicancri]
MPEHVLIFLIDTLILFLLVLSFYLITVYGYNLLLSLFAFKKAKRDYNLLPDKSRFLILVAAHNEEKVIRTTIKELKKIAYDPRKFDIFIVSDRSEDRTTQIAVEEDVKVIDTILDKFPREGIGKPAGLQYALREIGFDNVRENYDLVMILDADNFVDYSILRELNSQFIEKGRPQVIQSYLDSKNHNKAMSLAYSMVFWTNNRFSQVSRYRLKLNNSIGGTGFVVRSDYLIGSGGFNYSSLTEDLEMEIEIVKKNGRILWNEFAAVYDEKPEKLGVSMKQRHRWAKGHFYVAFKQFLPLLWLSIRHLDIRYLDKVFFLMTMARSTHFILMSLAVLLSALLLAFEGELYTVFTNATLTSSVDFINKHFIFANIMNIILLSYSFIFLPLFATYSKIKNRRFIRNISVFLYYIVTDFIIQILAMFTWPKQNSWYKTPHIQNEIKELDEEEIIDGTGDSTPSS